MTVEEKMMLPLTLHYRGLGIKRAMKIYSFYSFGMAALLILTQLIRTPYSQQSGAQNIYIFAIALLHAIFGIWFLKGKDSIAFARASAVSRLGIGCGFIAMGALQFGAISTGDFPLPAYLLMHGTVDLLVAILALWLMRKQPRAERNQTPLTLEYYNRFLFALYMIALSPWLLLHSTSFVGFFHLPPIADAENRHFPSNALQIFAILLLQLSLFNIVAVRHRIEPLIAAGMRGGLFTCIFVLLLVVLHVVHPLVLLLPAVDLISIAVIAVSRFRHRQNQR